VTSFIVFLLTIIYLFIYLFILKLEVMNSKVFVQADETGAVITVSENNPEFGYVRVQQTRTMIDDNGFVRRREISALMPGSVEDLKALNLYGGQALDGKIVIEESLNPFNKKNPERDLKVAGETGIVCTLGGLPIYRRTKFSFNESTPDTTVDHDNVDQLRAAYAAQQSNAALQPAEEDFTIEQ
jgi:hypothetical protein